MEEYQALEAMYAVRDVMASDAMNFFAIMSAYLIAAYAVGERLTTFQVWSISLLYTVYASFPLVGTYIAVTDLWGLEARAPHGATNYFSLIPWVSALGWATSIVFMIHARRNPR